MAAVYWFLGPAVLVVSAVAVPWAAALLTIVQATWGVEMYRESREKIPADRVRAGMAFAAIGLVFLLGHFRPAIGRDLDIVRLCVGLPLIYLAHAASVRLGNPITALVVAGLVVLWSDHSRSVELGQASYVFDCQAMTVIALQSVLASRLPSRLSRPGVATLLGLAALAAAVLCVSYASEFHYFSQYREP